MGSYLSRTKTSSSTHTIIVEPIEKVKESTFQETTEIVVRSVSVSEPPKEDVPKEEAPKEEEPKEEVLKEEQPKEEAPKEEQSKEEAPKEEQPSLHEAVSHPHAISSEPTISESVAASEPAAKKKKKHYYKHQKK